MLREKRREEFKTTEIKRDENENILSTFLSKVFLAVFPRNTLTLSAILSTEKNYYTSHANSSGVHSGRTRVILFFIDQLPRQFLQSIHSSSTTACSFFHHFFFFFLPRFHASNHVACLCYVDTRVLVNRAERSFYAEKIIFLTSWQLRPL